MNSYAFGVVLLAAGTSSRMGQPKLLLPWGNTSVLGHLIAIWKEVGAAQIGAVCAVEDNAIETELNRLRFPTKDRIVNPDPTRGMFSSIQCAARWSGWDSHITHWVIALGDQPHLRMATLRAVITRSQNEPNKICQPALNDRPRHPVVLPRTECCDLATSSCATLKEFLQTKAAQIDLVASDDPGLDLDINQPADYEKALLLRE